jgi:sucrose-6-phosphate hydrolase SacC (GH32 family)
MPFHLRGYPAQVAIRPDTPYDESGVFSGSATVVDGVPVLSYSVENQQVMAFAVPADLSDPLFTKWSKPAYNPVMRYAEVANITDVGHWRDPTNGWKGADGEWRMLTGCDGAPCLFKSHDFQKWASAGKLDLGPLNNSLPGRMLECPGFHPIPGTSPEKWLLKVKVPPSAEGGTATPAHRPSLSHPAGVLGRAQRLLRGGRLRLRDGRLHAGHGLAGGLRQPLRRQGRSVTATAAG